MKLHFDAQQPYQLDAIRAVVDVFAGQTVAVGAVEGGRANELSLPDERLLANVRAVQERNRIRLAEKLARDDVLGSRNFSVEMETGTGKTYVFLRTIHELHRVYGWKKFVIVAPSVPIREGVTQSIAAMEEHFSAIYGRVPLDSWVYDSAEAAWLRQFALSDQVQILVMNIQAFDKKSVAVVHQTTERGYKPIEFIQQSRPIVIMDEPQNMESENARRAIRSLNPLFTLRYSATHRNVHNLVYRLDPVRAYDLGLVKRIEVDSVTDGGDFNRPFLTLERVTASKRGLVAKLTLDVETTGGVRRKTISVRRREEDLFVRSGEREVYRGYVVAEINAESDFVRFGNGVVLRVGESQGRQNDLVMRVQIEETIREHFRKELALGSRPEGERIKVLSLFFIDRVANYARADGKIRRWFEESYRKLAALPEFAALAALPVEQVHNGYFACDKEGPKDSSDGKSSKADDEAYRLIMRDKERLLSPDEPLRFIFSHSALREGWDNPNVFQICTLREGQSEIRKRQEVGRGLRLARMENGYRCEDPKINRLTLIANESFAEFARTLQTEIEEECGVAFGERIVNKRERRKLALRKERLDSEEFRFLWERISPRTRYRVEFSTEELVTSAAQILRDEPEVSEPRIVVTKAEVIFATSGMEEVARMVEAGARVAERPSMPDIIGYLQRETELTRSTIAAILRASGRSEQALKNPQQFMEQAARAILQAKRELMVEGIRYERVAGEAYAMRLFAEEEIESSLGRVVSVKRSIYDAVECESEAERAFAAALDADENVRLFLKLPRWFVVKTPLGDYRPGWAIVREGEARAGWVVEIRDAIGLRTLSADERLRIKCGGRHFVECLGVAYKVGDSAGDFGVSGARGRSAAIGNRTAG